MQTRWSALINPLLQRSQNESNILNDVLLATGSNTIPHNLNKKLTGWKLVRQRAAASIYDNQDTNPTPETTLILVSSAPVMVNIEVF